MPLLRRPLEFDSGLQKMKCPYCDTTFDVETLEGYDDALKQDAKDDMHWDAAQQPWDDVQMAFTPARAAAASWCATRAPPRRPARSAAIPSC